MRVLIVDDEPLIRRSLERVFSKRGHEVALSEDGKVAIDQWEKFQPDIAIVDVLMPEKTGPELIEEVGPSDRTGVILISAYSGEYNPESAKKLGADLFIAKPFDDIHDIVRRSEELHAEKIR